MHTKDQVQCMLCLWGGGTQALSASNGSHKQHCLIRGACSNTAYGVAVVRNIGWDMVACLVVLWCAVQQGNS